MDFPEDRYIWVGLGAQYQLDNDIMLRLACEQESLGQRKIEQTVGPLKGSLKGDYSKNAVRYFLFNFIQKF
jgi:opacity protein-like surface antigen